MAYLVAILFVIQSERKMLSDYLKDITERKKLEEELRKHHDQLQELVNERTAEITETNKKLMDEITERKMTEKRLHVKRAYLKLLQVTAVAANEATEINDAFQPILNEICDYAGWPIGHAYIISKDDPNLLEPTTVWYIEDVEKFTNFRNVTEATKFAKGIGLPGRVLASGKPHWIVDVTKDKNFLRANIARDMHIKSGIAFPVMVGTSVVAVLEFFTTDEVKPNQQFLDIMADVGTQLGRVIERKRAEEGIKTMNESLEQRITKRTAELTKANEELLKMQKLESVGVLAGGIAHDFNNSLQAILGYVTLAEMHTNSNNEICEYLEETRKAVLQSRGLTQQLLTFSKGGAPVKKAVSVSELIMNSTKLALSGSNIKCELGLSGSLWQVEADKWQVNQVISNLIINAGQAMPEGGNIKVLAENTDIAERDSFPLQEGRYVKITIEDYGTGISQEHLQKIFDPYFTTKKNGSGLGLATSYSIIKKHNGHITVESEIGIGTTFQIYLPASRKAIQERSVLEESKSVCPAPAEEEDKEKPIVSKGKILIMDDEYVIRTVLCKQLRGLKYEVEAVEEGTEAIRLYESASRTGRPFDAVIMDLTIPGGMGGKEAIKRLVEIDPEVKAIVVSGYANDPVMANYKKYGFSGVLPKPHEIHELDETLQKVIMEVS
jgi:signal transduction histidine kinase/CheY-like chemotaxis protein